MIIEEKPITMAETKDILKSQESEKSKSSLAIIKKFSKMSADEAKKIFSEIKKLNIEKLKDNDITRIVDFLPEDPEDLRKIFSGSDLNFEQDEITKILAITKTK